MAQDATGAASLWWWGIFVAMTALAVVFSVFAATPVHVAAPLTILLFVGGMTATATLSKNSNASQKEQAKNAFAAMSTKEGGRYTPQEPLKAKVSNEDESECKLEDEPWFPVLELKDWREASELSGSPWTFDSCASVSDAMQCVWRVPLNAAMQHAFDALQARVKGLRVAKVSFNFTDEVFFAVVYRLNSGAELFGGAPLDHAVGVELGSTRANMELEAALRRRRGGGSPKVHTSDMEGAHSIPLPCLAPFYRIHDGFGVLLSTSHLPVLLQNPSDTVAGSCFYAFPVRALGPLSRDPRYLKFARVDSKCLACGDRDQEHPHVVFADQNADLVDDDEGLLDFLADTICNICGQQVVPNTSGAYGHGSCS